MDFEEIKATQDRDFTEQLFVIAFARETPDDERDQAVDILRELEDPRISEALVEIGLDKSRPRTLRDAAFEILSAAGGMPTDGSTLRRWWASEDSVLRRWAVLLADRDESDIIAPVADDPSHPLYREAIDAIEVGFEEPEWQERKIKALSHQDAAVRSLAAHVLLWDEPLAAEKRLIASTLDADERVRESAYWALEYYVSRDVVAHVAEHRDDPLASELYDQLRVNFVDELQAATHYSPKGVAPLLEWMKPIAGLFQITDAEMVFHPSGWTPSEKPASTVSLDDLISQLEDPFGKWAPKYELMSGFDWATVPGNLRDEVGQLIQHHVDPEVRLKRATPLQHGMMRHD